MNDAMRQNVGVDVPVHVAHLFEPSIIMVRNWPRVWTFKCGRCSREMSRFGWFGFARCRFCRQLNAPKWNFDGTGY